MAAKAGTFTPAEHLPHQRTLTAWPRLPGAYDNQKWLENCRREVAAIANAISEFEPVWLYATPGEDAASARQAVNSKVVVKEAHIDNLWIRDVGPVFVRGGSSGVDGAIDFNFNYWGQKCDPTVDPEFARTILAQDFSGLTRHQAGLISEGGALEVDGEATLMVSDSSIVNPNRNPNLTQDEIETELKRLLGVTKVIWLEGIVGLESTDWHVDAFARFAAPGHVLLSKPQPNADRRIHRAYNSAIETLSRATDAKGRRIKVTSVLEPDYERLPGDATEAGTVASYVNYLLVNGGVVMAKFGQEDTDRAALELFKSVFPARRIRQVYINQLPMLGGGIHCATQHIPA